MAMGVSLQLHAAIHAAPGGRFFGLPELARCQCPRHMSDVLVSAVKQLLAAAARVCPKTMSADLLLPLLSWLCVCADVPHLVRCVPFTTPSHSTADPCLDIPSICMRNLTRASSVCEVESVELHLRQLRAKAQHPSGTD